ncbi:MAG: hypothetical protein JXA07_06335 [Spirochaetes bacterium]|nr:hypothetical protein [Spirochaetota bacterium]
MGTKSGGSKASKKPKAAGAGKTAVKKSSSAKRLPAKPKKKSLEEQLRDEIRAMTLTLTADSLKKLMQDAAILAHNERVLADYKDSRRPAAARGRTGTVLAEIEKGRDETYYIIILNNYRNFLSLDEMRKLVALCRGADNARDAAARLYAWIERDRRDIRKNSKIFEPDHPALPALWEKIIAGYDLK